MTAVVVVAATSLFAPPAIAWVAAIAVEMVELVWLATVVVEIALVPPGLQAVTAMTRARANRAPTRTIVTGCRR